MDPEVTLVWPEVNFMAPKFCKSQKNRDFSKSQKNIRKWATSCTLSGFLAFLCKFSRRYVKAIVLGAANNLNPQFATVTLKLGQSKKLYYCS